MSRCRFSDRAPLPYAGSVPSKVELPGRELLEDQVRRLLDRARRRSGASVEEIVQELGQLQAKGAGTRRSWYDWHERPETVSSLTILGVLHVLGPEGAVEVLFGRSATTKGNALQAQVADLERQLAEQRAGTRQLERRLEDLASRVGAGGKHGTRVDVERLLQEVEEAVQQAGQALGRPWTESPVSAAADEESTVVRRRLSAVQARIVEFRSMVGEPWRGTYPSAPGAGASDLEVTAWIRAMLRILAQQADELLSHPTVRAGASRQRRSRPGTRRHTDAG
jgi:hypothetical protein